MCDGDEDAKKKKHIVELKAKRGQTDSSKVYLIKCLYKVSSAAQNVMHNVVTAVSCRLLQTWSQYVSLNQCSRSLFYSPQLCNISFVSFGLCRLLAAETISFDKLDYQAASLFISTPAFCAQII